MRALVRRRSLLWPAFIAVHLVLAAICLVPGPTGASFNDVTGFYRVWIDNALHGYGWPAIDAPWVYPIVALVPMLIPRMAGDAGYGALWLLLVSLLNAAAFASLLSRPSVSRVRAAWYWLIALIALGPVSLGRLDIVSVALAVLGIVALETRPWLAGVLLAIGAWVKFWPVALIAAAVVAAKERWRVLVGAVGASVVIVALALWVLRARFLFSFIGQQSGRGLQIESVFATPLLWGVWAGVPGLKIYYDTGIYTFQVAGPGAAALAAAADWAMPLAVAVAIIVGVIAVVRRAEPRYVVALLGLALTVGFCVFDKVGSPQYQTWFPVPVMLGMMVAGRRFRLPAILVMISLALTQLIYPWFYEGLTGAQATVIGLVTVRNVLDVVIFAWALVALWSAGARRTSPRRRGKTA
ncbi:glycosyltransferase 87 family protein [Gryllotalpicola reticulitermitis]|uniref:Glycosyltransferase 87 family protein n=1 Tax=Gryllotalpicola reticulitermitis TaxID=1184153 RepID=A0ABV8QBM2_9MICO